MMTVNEDREYGFWLDEAMTTINTSITFEQGVEQLRDILGEEAEYYDVKSAADDFYGESGHADFNFVSHTTPEYIDDIMEGHLKPEYEDL